MSFAEDQLRLHAELWDHMLTHPFLVRAAEGTLAEDTFGRWLRQDYHFVRSARPFLGVLVDRAPEAHRDFLVHALSALGDELELFREQARSLGVSLDAVEPGLVCHAYVQFLLATVHRRDYREALTVYYVAEKAYHECWKRVAGGTGPRPAWEPLVDQWAADAFGDFVAGLGARLNGAADGAPAADRESMSRLFRRTILYEIAFWQMALQGPRWPGVPA